MGQTTSLAYVDAIYEPDGVSPKEADHFRNPTFKIG